MRVGDAVKTFLQRIIPISGRGNAPKDTAGSADVGTADRVSVATPQGGNSNATSNAVASPSPAPVPAKAPGAPVALEPPARLTVEGPPPYQPAPGLDYRTLVPSSVHRVDTSAGEDGFAAIYDKTMRHLDPEVLDTPQQAFEQAKSASFHFDATQDSGIIYNFIEGAANFGFVNNCSVPNNDVGKAGQLVDHMVETARSDASKPGFLMWETSDPGPNALLGSTTTDEHKIACDNGFLTLDRGIRYVQPKVQQDNDSLHEVPLPLQLRPVNENDNTTWAKDVNGKIVGIHASALKTAVRTLYDEVYIKVNDADRADTDRLFHEFSANVDKSQSNGIVYFEGRHGSQPA